MRFQSLPRKLTCTLENWRTAFLLKYFWVHVSFRECISTTPNVDFGLKAHRLAELLTARWNLDQGCLQSGSLMIEFAGGKVVVLQFSNTCWSKQLAIWRQMAPYFCFGIKKKQSAGFNITPFARASSISKECATTYNCFESEDIWANQITSCKLHGFFTSL